MKSIKEKAQIGLNETERQRQIVIKECKAVGLTSNKTFKAIAEGLQAHEVKTNYDKDRGQWKYSGELIDHKTRLTAAGLAITVLDLKPPEKKELTGSLTLNHELPPEVETLFDKIYSKGDNDKKRKPSKL